MHQPTTSHTQPVAEPLTAPASLFPRIAQPEADSVSPALRETARSASQAAFEIKFVLTAEQAETLEQRLAPRMTLDPYADITRGDTYAITSLYTDTPTFDAYHRRGRLKSTKFRVRRYDVSNTLFVEQKTKRQQLVRKQRSSLTAGELSQLLHDQPISEWKPDWFRHELQRRQLQPVCRVSYERKAFFASSETGPARLTFDRNLRGAAIQSWAFSGDAECVPFASDVVVCEFKFLVSMPALFRGAVEDLQLVPGSFSKYRRCVDLLGLLPRQEARDA